MGGYFDMVDPFTVLEYVIEDGWQGVLVTGQSSACSAHILQSAYGFNYFAGFGISLKDNVCVAEISSGVSGGNGSDFSTGYMGSITVPVSELFGSHTITETGQSCQAIWEWDEETQQTINVGSCWPVEAYATVTIS